MTDRPIIFSAPMIRALIDGRKTQTRRVIKLCGRLPEFCGGRGDLDDPTLWGWEDANYGDWMTLEKEPGQRMGWRDWVGAPRAGGRLWVRETWAAGNIYDQTAPRDINPGGKPGWCGLRYAATDERKGIKDRSSIHMPRWASRLTLAVTEVRVQRLQEITSADAIAEGIPASANSATIDCDTPDPRDGFRSLWNSLHGHDAWAANPWVCAISFDVRRGNIDEVALREGERR